MVILEVFNRKYVICEALKFLPCTLMLASHSWDYSTGAYP